MTWGQLFPLLAGGLLAGIGLRAIARRELPVSENRGFSIARSRTVRGRPAVLMGLWLLLVGLGVLAWGARRAARPAPTAPTVPPAG